MKEKKLQILILLGTAHSGRMSEHVAKYIEKKAKSHKEIEARLFDVRDFNFSQKDEGTSMGDKNIKWKKAVINADGIIIVSPEYNHGYPGSLKYALDTLLPEYIHKAVALCGVSSGGFGGTRVIEALLSVVRELGLVATFTDLNVSRVKRAFDEKGNLLDEKLNVRIDGFLEELIWMAKTLRYGRENIQSKHHEK